MTRLRSMTGFGAAAGASEPGVAVRVEVRSVNHRHLAVKLRLPEAYTALEPEVEARVRAKCERGAVSVSLSAERSGANLVSRLDRELARRYQRELLELAAELELGPAISLDTLVALPGVVGGTAEDGANGPLQAAILELVDEALERMLAMRTAEGANLAADLRKHARALAQLAARIEKRMPRIVRAHRSALAKRVQALLGNQAALAPADIAREVALLADRLDVSEELARLSSHLEQFESFLKKGGRVGRQLDFLVQEIFREVNTIGAKCADATVAHWVVEAKASVERLREQVQNVE
jgi:uncharacterized protein (TIGR00255 family)